MKYLLILSLTIFLISCENKENAQVITENQNIKLDSLKDRVSYVFGVQYIKNVMADYPEFNKENFIQGMMDYLKDSTKLKMNQDSMDLALMTFDSIRRKNEEEKLKKIEMEMEEKSKKIELIKNDILTNNQKNPKVQTTKSGIQFTIVKDGKGNKPKRGEVVVTKVKGWLLDSTKVLDTDEIGKPMNFILEQTLVGWTETLSMMSVGSVYDVLIPSQLLFGNNPAPKVPANSPMFFRMELLEIKDPSKFVGGENAKALTAGKKGNLQPTPQPPQK